MPSADGAESILVVDDDEIFRERLARALRARGYTVTEAGDCSAAFDALDARAFDRAVVDLRLPSGSGLNVVRALKQAQPDVAIVVLTGYGSIATALEAMRLGATHYLTKPAGVDAILAGFDRAATSAALDETAAHEVPTLAHVEWEHINRVLADAGGNVSEAARRLGMHRRSLQRKLAKLPGKR
jgi:two-component system response regulator RegA